MSNSLVSTQNRVESPFIIAQIGKYTFGNVSKQNLGGSYKVTYPNYMESLNIVKINGTVNTYTLVMVYAIASGDDPNLLEKVFSSVAKDRTIILKYGDWNVPTYIYKEEKAIITNIATNVDLKASKIQYTLKCTSTSLALKSGKFNFGARTAKPSDVIKELLKDESKGLLEIFPGMKNAASAAFDGFIDSTDKEVHIGAKSSISILDYIGYLVGCMVNVNDSSDALKQYNYFWSVYDDISNAYGGSYFKVISVQANAQYNVSYNTYEVNVGYPTSEYVESFTINNNESWSMLYDYSEKLSLPSVTHSIDDYGNIVEVNSPNITTSASTLTTTETSRSWWSKMTQFPITAKLVIKGLLRPALLMSYVKVNAYFYGSKHVSSGLYIITKQEDSISSNGYRTTLSLTRISGDTNYV